MSCELRVFLYGAGTVIVVDAMIFLIGWTSYRDAEDANDKNRSTIIRVFMATFLVAVTIGGLFFSLVLGAGTCH